MLEVEEPEYLETPHTPSHTAAGGKVGLDLASNKVTKARKTKL
jgi:hypothetical protein